MTDARAKQYDNGFGGCPQCGGTHGYLNIGRDHWFVCDDHKTKWRVGSNLFSSWKDETDEEWASNKLHLEGYEEVRPVRTERTRSSGRQGRAEGARPSE
jgi:ssDNA-binding Zn-finger/Zn-ribbon topoisomerase 1